jgi:hypothetical protein
MNDRTVTMLVVRSASESIWRPRLFRATYIVVCLVAVFGWTVALSWMMISLLMLFVNQFT